MQQHSVDLFISHLACNVLRKLFDDSSAWRHVLTLVAAHVLTLVASDTSAELNIFRHQILKPVAYSI